MKIIVAQRFSLAAGSLVRGLSDALYQVNKGKIRMTEKHAWSCIAHDGADLISHVWPIAMHRAFGTHRLCLLKRALLQTGTAILQQGRAFRAKP